jgi:hypothetical protein
LLVICLINFRAVLIFLVPVSSHLVGKVNEK